MKRITAITAAVLLFALCLLGAAAPLEDAAGEYTLFTLEIMGEQKPPESMGLEGKLSLNQDGTGVFSMSGTDEPVAKWEVKDDVLLLYNDEGYPLEARLDKDVIEMEMGAGFYLYFAREGFDTTGFTISGHTPDTKLYQAFRAINAKEGAHLGYEYHSDYMDSTSIFDTHVKGDRFISLRTTKASGYEQRSATAFVDGTCYNLYPDEKRGSAVLSISLSLLQDNVLLLDDCYKTLYQSAMRTDCTEETQEVDGKSYSVEVFPAEDYTPEVAFYFDEAGKLVHILEGEPVLMTELGETFYTIHAVDTAVDETLFDLSGYAIEG